MLHTEAFQSNHLGQSVPLYCSDRIDCGISALRSASEPDKRNHLYPKEVYFVANTSACARWVPAPPLLPSPSTRCSSILLLEKAGTAWNNLRADNPFHSFLSREGT